MKSGNMIHKIFAVMVFALLFAGAFADAPPAGGTSQRNPARASFKRRPPRVFLSRLSPEERAEVDRLAREGKKEELHQLMRSLFHKYRPAEMKKLDELSRRYLQTTDEQERAAIRQEMERLARSLFQKRQNFTRNNIAETERKLAFAKQELDRLKQHFQDNEKNAEKIIADRVEQYCLPPEQRRKPGYRGFEKKTTPPSESEKQN